MKPSRIMRSSPPTFRLPPHWGHDVGSRFSNPLEGLVGSKTEFSVPNVSFVRCEKQFTGEHRFGQTLRSRDGSRNSRRHCAACPADIGRPDGRCASRPSMLRHPVTAYCRSNSAMTDTIGEFRPRPAALGLQFRRHARIGPEADPQLWIGDGI